MALLAFSVLNEFLFAVFCLLFNVVSIFLFCVTIILMTVHCNHTYIVKCVAFCVTVQNVKCLIAVLHLFLLYSTRVVV